MSARAPAFRAFDTEHVELADEIAEDDRAFARHYDIDLLNSLRVLADEKMIFGTWGSQTELVFRHWTHITNGPKAELFGSNNSPRRMTIGKLNVSQGCKTI